MKRNLQDIDKLFKDGLEDHPEPAPPGVWDAVNNDLDKKQAIVFKEKYTRLKRLSLVLLLFIFSGIACLVYFVKSGKTNDIAQTQTGNNKENAGTDTKSNVPTANDATARNENAVAAETTNTKHREPLITSNPAGETTVAVTEKTASDHKELAAADNLTATSNKAIEKKNVQKALPVDIAKNETNATTDIAANVRVSNSNNNRKTQQQPLLIDGKGTAVTQQKHVISTGINTAEAFDVDKLSANNNYRQGDNKKLATSINVKDQNKNALLSEANKQLSAIQLAPYTEQAPLLLTVIDGAMPGPLVTMEHAPFLNSVTQSDSLKKAIALAAKKGVTRHPVSLSVFVSPNHSFTRLENDLQLAGPGRDKRVAERDERQGSSFSAGVLLNYGLSKSLILQSGLVFSSAKTNISPKIIYARPDNFGHPRYEFNCASGYSYITPKGAPMPTVGDSIQAIGSSSTISYIGIPVSLNYVWQRGRFLLKPGIGFSINFLTNGSSNTTLHTVTNQKEATTAVISGLRKAYVDASVGFGAELMLNRTISVGVRPQLRMALTSINKNTPIKTYQNFLSFETGLRINL